MSASSSVPSARTVTPEELMAIVDFTELEDGRWKAVLDAGTGGKLSIVSKTLPGVSRAMQSLCRAVAAKVEAQRHGARQAESLMRKILSDLPQNQPKPTRKK
jgi:hypothetical protein